MDKFWLLISEIGIIFGSYFLLSLFVLFVVLLIISKKHRDFVTKMDRILFLFCTVASTVLFSGGLWLNYHQNLGVFVHTNFVRDLACTYFMVTILLAAVSPIEKLFSC